MAINEGGGGGEGSGGGGNTGAEDPFALWRVAMGYGNSPQVAQNIQQQNWMNTSTGLNIGGNSGTPSVFTPGQVPGSGGAGSGGIADMNGQNSLGTGLANGTIAPGDRTTPIFWGSDVDPRVATGIAGGVGGFLLGGPAGALAGYGAGSYLGGKYGNSEYDPTTGRYVTPGTGGGGSGPLGPTIYGTGAQGEANRMELRGNVIGDAWQSNYGNPNAQTTQGWAGQQQQRSNIIGDAFQNNYGNPNQQAMAGDAEFYNQRAGGYVRMGVDDTNAATGLRGQQMAYGDNAYNVGSSQFGRSDYYGGAAQGDYARQAALGAQQQQNAATAGRTGASMFQQGYGFGGAAQGDAAAAAAARQGQQAFGALGSGYGSSQMGTSAGLLGGAAQDYQNQQGSRGQAEQALGRLQNFYEQGPGPSAAQAQLQQASEANMSSALALARSGRGAGQNASAMRQAQFQNAATQQQTGQQMAQLRAQEAATWRGQQLGAMGQEQQSLGNLRGQDLSAMGQNLGAAAQFGGLGYQGIGIGANQQNTARGQDITSQGQNLGAMQGLYGLGLQGLGQQQSGLQGARGQELQAYGANIGAQQGMGALGYQGYGMGLNAAQGAGQQALTSAGQNQGMGLGYAQLGQGYQNIGLQNQLAYAQIANQQYQAGDQLAAQYRMGGLQNQLGYASMANQQYQTADQLRAQILNAQLQADTARYGADRGVQVGMAQLQAQQQAALIGAVGAGVGALSDIRSKKNIKSKPFNGLLGDLFSKKGDDEGDDYADYKAGLKPGAPSAELSTPRAQLPVGATAPWEMGVSPFAQQAPPQPFGQDPRNQQRTVGIDFSQPPGAYADSDKRGKTAIERMKDGYVSSPREAKRDIRPVSMASAPPEYADAWRGVSMQDSMAPPETQPAFSFSAPPAARPGADLRPAKGYSYEYKDPQSPGAAPGRHFGPMAQDLEKTPAGKSVVKTGPDGMKSIDTARLSLVNTSAISEQQRRLDRLEAIAKAKFDTGALDDAYARQTADTGVRSDERSKKKKRSMY